MTLPECIDKLPAPFLEWLDAEIEDYFLNGITEFPTPTYAAAQLAAKVSVSSRASTATRRFARSISMFLHGAETYAPCKRAVEVAKVWFV